MGNSWRTIILAAGVLLGLSATLAVAAPSKSKPAAVQTVAPPPPADVEPAAQPRVYLFRGALGPLFSTGMDRLAEKLTQAGLEADVYEFTICRPVAEHAISKYREAPAPIVLIGHSMGGLCALVFAEMLGKENIPVNLVVTIDPAQASPNVPLNVERFINIFLSDSVLGGGDIVAEPGYRGHYASFDLKENRKVSHINIEKSDDIHRQIVDMVLKVSRVPAQTEADAVPLRYLVPGDTKVELWDSGVRMPALPGETLQSVAALHHVPVWSLVQVNSLPENVPLPVGQAVVVPRHLLPAGTDAAPATPVAVAPGKR